MADDLTVVKRTGKIVPFNKKKIFNAISGANKDAGNSLSKSDINKVVDRVISLLELKEKTSVTVERIQDYVEAALIASNYADVAKAYILYRQKHAEIREAQKHLVDTFDGILFSDANDMDLKRDNANVNTDAPMGIMLKMGAEASKYYVDNHILPDTFRKADKENYIHIHDKDFSLMCINCCQIDLLKLFHGGFSTGHGFLREPNSIRAYSSLACIAIQSNQNDMLGGQSINAWDYAMAEGIRKSFKKAFKEKLEEGFAFLDDDYLAGANEKFIKLLLNKIDWSLVRYTEEQTKLRQKALDSLLSAVSEACKDNAVLTLQDQYYFDGVGNEISQTAYKLACKSVEEETHQAMEAAIHNFNTLHSRAGAQVAFSSINYGMDTSPEGRLSIRETLNAINSGLGHGETPIFPISIFVLKAGVNYNPEDANYDLFKLACEVSAKRLFPNFSNLDAPYNLQYYKANDYNSYIALMGCRTRVMSNVNGPEQSGSRGNFSFVTINLPKLAIEAKHNIDKFFKLFDKYIQISHDYLHFRLKFIESKHVYNYPFLMGQGIWLDSDKLKPNDVIKDVLKHASYSVGFCGLAECLVALIGKHHGESEEAQELGLRIIKHLRDMTDKYTEDEHMNWSTFATPAESTAGSFQRANQKAYGIIPGVTDRPYLTNSFHCPVYYPISAMDKIRAEAPYHELCNAGHISYIELDGDPTNNLKAFESVVRAMHDANMGYFSINHPVDRDPVCGYTGIIKNECPHCHRKEVEHKQLRIRKITTCCDS